MRHLFGEAEPPAAGPGGPAVSRPFEHGVLHSHALGTAVGKGGHKATKVVGEEG